MKIGAKTMWKLSKILGKDSYIYQQTVDYLDTNLMNKLHWSEFTQSYADYGLHSDNVRLERPKSLPRQQNQNMEMQRIVLKKPEYRLVDTTFGYISLFPFFLQLLESDSPYLGKILADLRKPELLWTPFGLRSLSKSSPLYMKRNTEHDPPYWRGQIWININFLVTRALYKYSHLDGPYQSLAREIYQDLRHNIINNVMSQYFKTGYIWEQYNDKSGEGTGCRPFNGWTALVVLLMGEQY